MEKSNNDNNMEATLLSSEDLNKINNKDIEDEEGFTQEEINEALQEIAQEESLQNIDYETGEILNIHNEEYEVLEKLFEIFENQITLR